MARDKQPHHRWTNHRVARVVSKINRRELLTTAAVLTAAPALAQRRTGNPTARVEWRRVVTNGGGLVTGLSIASDGTQLCRTDVGGAYLWGGSTWKQLLTSQRMGRSLPFGGYRGLNGTTDIQVAPSNKSIIYCFCLDAYANRSLGTAKVYKSVDGGRNFLPTSYPVNAAVDGSNSFYLGPNSDLYKRVQNKIGIDPANPDVVYACNPGGRPLVTVSGGAAWSAVPDLPTGTALGAVCWAFDPSGGRVGNRTKNIFVAIAGSGAWKSTDAGASFTQTSTDHGNIAPGYCAVSSDGVYYLSDLAAGGFGRLSRYQSGEWITVVTDGSRGNVRAYFTIAAHPVARGVLCLIRTTATSRWFNYSSNYGRSFVSYSKESVAFTSLDTPWLAAQMTTQNMGSTSALFDPANPNDLYLCLGQGLWKATIAEGVVPRWSTFTTGIEELVCNDIIHESGTDLYQLGWDMGTFNRPTSALDTAPANPLGGPLLLAYNWSVAIDPADHRNVVIIGSSAATSWYTRNGGATWSNFSAAAFPRVIGSYAQVMINKGVIMIAPANSAQGYWYRSTDWTLSWTEVRGAAIIGTTIPTSGWTGWATSVQSPKHTGCADTVNPRRFYIYNSLFGAKPDVKGMYRSTDGGATFTFLGPIRSDPFSASSFLGVTQMRCVPGIEGYLFAATGYVQSTAHPINAPFPFSTDGGETWANVAGMKEVNKFGFGKARANGGVPTLYVAGFYNNVYGIWASYDLGASFSQLVSASYGIWPLTNDAVTCLDGDKDVFGRCYVGFRGTGAAYSTMDPPNL